MRELIVSVAFRRTYANGVKYERVLAIKPLFFLEKRAYGAIGEMRSVLVFRFRVRGKRIAAELQLISGKLPQSPFAIGGGITGHTRRRMHHERATSASFCLARVVDRSYSEI
jgi:hypothetical protein